jgi:mitogen-activated protein kinase kinase kinase 13
LVDVTAKGLARLRRDDLVKLCESKNLSAEGTKVKLAHTLIEWRDRHYISDTTSVATSSPSSSSTVRAHDTPRKSGTKTTRPVLMRSSRIHADQPVTPTPGLDVINDPGNGKIQTEPEIELDLESLGLEDKEIDCQRLTKLEKIGSGGFKEYASVKLHRTTLTCITASILASFE